MDTVDNLKPKIGALMQWFCRWIQGPRPWTTRNPVDANKEHRCRIPPQEYVRKLKQGVMQKNHLVHPLSSWCHRTFHGSVAAKKTPQSDEFLWQKFGKIIKTRIHFFTQKNISNSKEIVAQKQSNGTTLKYSNKIRWNCDEIHRGTVHIEYHIIHNARATY